MINVADVERARAGTAPAVPNSLAEAAEAVWVVAQRSTWTSLVLVPADATLSTGPLAVAVAAAASAQRGEPVEYLDLREVTLVDSRPVVDKLADKNRRWRYVAAVHCPLESQAALLLASAADAAILVIEKEQTLLRSARRILDLLGEDRFLGAVLVGPGPG
jgi:hypothetical protein